MLSNKELNMIRTSERQNVFSIKVVFLLLLVLCLSAALRTQYIAKSPTISHDEAISYLSATGNQGDFARVVREKMYPYGQWVQAKEWQRYIELTDHFIFKKIQNDLSSHDVHPPLYFWLLHIWAIIFGVHTWTGPSLNILISTVNILILYLFAHFILDNRNKALAVAFTYSMSPGVMSATFLARNYELFTFFSILLVWKSIKIIVADRKPSIFDITYIAIIAACGLLTHYYFGLFILGVMATFIFFLFFTSWKEKVGANYLKVKTITIYMGVAVGILLFFIVHPTFFQQLSTFQSSGQHFDFFTFILRVAKSVLAFCGYFVTVTRRSMPPLSVWILIFLCILLLLPLLISIIKKEYSMLKEIKLNEKELIVLIFSTTVTSLIVILYISFFTHQAVMGPRYLAPLFPFLALLTIILLRLWKHKEKTVIIAYCAIMMFSGTAFAKPWHKYGIDKAPIIERCDNILLDSTKRGVLLVYMMNIPPGKKVYCAMQDDLLADDSWLRGITENSLYLSELKYGNSEEKRKKIQNKLSRLHNITLAEGGEWGIWGLGQLFVITTKFSD